jgi:hypothetical protein
VGEKASGPVHHTAEDASPQELRRASLRLLGMLMLLGVLVIPFLRPLSDTPGGETTRVGLLAWLLVGLALYWLYAGMGYQPILLIQLMAFSAAATLLTTKAALVLVGIAQVGVLRWAARILIILGALLAVGNLGSMLLALWRRRT